MPELQKRLVPYSSDDIQYMTQDVIIINNTRIPNHPKIFQSFSQFAYSKSELKKLFRQTHGA